MHYRAGCQSTRHWRSELAGVSKKTNLVWVMNTKHGRRNGEWKGQAHLGWHCPSIELWAIERWMLAFQVSLRVSHRRTCFSYCLHWLAWLATKSGCRLIGNKSNRPIDGLLVVGPICWGSGSDQLGSTWLGELFTLHRGCSNQLVAHCILTVRGQSTMITRETDSIGFQLEWFD